MVSKLLVGAVIVAAVGYWVAQPVPSVAINELVPGASTTMRAAEYPTHGNAAEVIRVVQRAAPRVRANDVVIKVSKAALNPVDYKIIGGYLAMLEGLLLDAPPALTGAWRGSG